MGRVTGTPAEPRSVGTVPGAPSSPPARRADRPSWKDPRLLGGVAIVAASVLLGARVLAGADDTVAVWALRSGVPAGAELGVADLEPQEVRFQSSSLAGRYVSAADPIPEGSIAGRDLGAGELLPREALSQGAEESYVEVPLAVPSDAVPTTLRAGEVVDVWVTPTQDSDGDPRAIRVLEGVRVLAVPVSGSALGPSSTRQVLVGVPRAADTSLGRALAELSTGRPVVVRRG